jgi:hypothetical protein
MHAGKTRFFGAAMASIIGATLLGAGQVVAQDDTCRGGGPEYWVTNTWPAPFEVPAMFRQPNGHAAVVRPNTKFDAVFRYRKGRHSEGPIFPGETLQQVLQSTGTSKRKLARVTVAALLNSGEPGNDFDVSTGTVIKDFQVYWDGTYDMSPSRARRHMTAVMNERNAGACPA